MSTSDERQQATQDFSKWWTDDWQFFFREVCEKTGLSLQEAMLFHILTSSLMTRHATGYLADCQAHQHKPEPWQQPPEM